MQPNMDENGKFPSIFVLFDVNMPRVQKFWQQSVINVTEESNELNLLDISNK